MAKRADVAEAIANKAKVVARYQPKISLNARGGTEKALHDKRANGGHYNVTVNLDVPIFTGFEDLYQKRMAYADIKFPKKKKLN